MPDFNFSLPKLRNTVILPLHDLDQIYPKHKLADEMAKDRFIRIELFCGESPSSVELCKRWFAFKKVNIHIDQFAIDQMKKTNTEYLLFTDSLTTAEIQQLLLFLGNEDKKLISKQGKNSSSSATAHIPNFGHFVFVPSSMSDWEKLSRLLAVPVSKLRRTTMKPLPIKDSKKEANKLGKDSPKGSPKLPSKSMEELTGQSLLKAFGLPNSDSFGLPNGRENTSKSGSKLPNSKNNSKKENRLSSSGIILSYSPVNNFPMQSKQIGSFLEEYTHSNPRGIPLMLVFRVIK